MPTAEPTPDTPVSGRRARLWRELAEHRTAYVVLVLGILLGAYIFPMIFPGVSAWKGALGGFFLGVWAALSAVPNKFIDE